MPVRQRERELRLLVKRLTNDFDITHTGGGHYKITLYGPLGSRFVIAAGSASDRRASKNLISDLSREILSLHPVAPIVIQPQPDNENAKVNVRDTRRHR